MESKDKIIQIQNKLDELLKKQKESVREIEQFKEEVNSLLLTDSDGENSTAQPIVSESSSEELNTDTTTLIPPPFEKHTSSSTPPHNGSTVTEKPSSSPILPPPLPKKAVKESSTPPPVAPVAKKKEAVNFEKLLGENLINKAGILILIIGVGIGTKYSIEHNLISPLLRIILGYIVGFGLFFTALRLREKYDNYSAVLVGGALTIFYFISYFAYAFYDLIPLPIAFVLMFLFTLFAVVAALSYNKQTIAIIGLVGAYGVPFLLSNNSGQVLILFSYMAIINTGILILSIKKYWRPLYYVAFGLSWMIFGTWQINEFIDEKSGYFDIAAIFLIVFFLLFYATLIFYKLVKEQKFVIGDIILVLLNSFIYYGLGYLLLNNQTWGADYLGLFTLVNAVIHFTVSLLIYRKQLADRNIFYLISGLVLVFITITIPIELSGGWISISWALLAALLFWIGRTKKVSFYELLSYPLILLSFFVFMFTPFGISSGMTGDGLDIPFFNVEMLISILIIASFAYITHLSQSKKYTPPVFIDNELTKIINTLIPTIFIFIVFITFLKEINYYFEFKLTAYDFRFDEDSSSAQSMLYTRNNLDLFKKIWLINYTLAFVAALSFVNLRFIKSKILNKVNLVLNLCVGLLFITGGLYFLKELRDIYLMKTETEIYNLSIFNILIRYISIAFLSLTVYSTYKCFNALDNAEKRFRMAIELILHISILTVLSSELMYWINTDNFTDSYTISLTVLWGLYSLFLIAYGIWKKRKHLRIGAIALFGITLYKLFFYDISNFNTLSKTIVFICLGLLLLVISFLYNKYKHIIFDDDETK